MKKKKKHEITNHNNYFGNPSVFSKGVGWSPIRNSQGIKFSNTSLKFSITRSNWEHIIKFELTTYLETIEEIKETPSYNNIIVQRDEESDDTAGDADASKPGMHSVPYPKGTEPHPLSHSNFDKEQGDAFQDQHHCEWYQKGTWNKQKQYYNL